VSLFFEVVLAKQWFVPEKYLVKQR